MAKEIKLRRCDDCGKLYADIWGKRWCVRCDELREQRIERIENAITGAMKRTISEIAEFTGIPEREVRRLVTAIPSLNWAVDFQEQCVRCRKEPAQPGSEFCLECRMELHERFEEVARELETEVRRSALDNTRKKPAGGFGSFFEKKSGRVSVDLSGPPSLRVR